MVLLSVQEYKDCCYTRKELSVMIALAPTRLMLFVVSLDTAVTIAGQED